MLIKERLNQCINSIVFKYFYKQWPYYLNEVFVKEPESGLSLKNSYYKLKHSFRKTSIGQSALSFIVSALWNKIPEEIKWTYSNINLRNTIWVKLGSQVFKK